MNTASYFIKELDATREIIEHCLEIIPDERLRIVPPHFRHPNAEGQAWLKESLGEWPALKVLVHLVLYEELVVVDEMERFILGKKVKFDEEKYVELEKKYFEHYPDKNDFIRRYRAVRKKQISLLESVDNHIFNEIEKETQWGKRKLNFVVNKTIQHTITHGSKLYQKALFWDMAWNALEKMSEK